MRGLLPALWSFLHHPAAVLEGHVSALEERLRGLETRLLGPLQTAADIGVVAAEETVTGAEHRIEEDLKLSIRGRVATIQGRLEALKTRVVEDLKHELRRVALVLALAIGCGALALVAMIFGLMAAWTGLRGFVGAVGASLVLTAVFLLGSLVLFGLLRATLNRSQSPHGAEKTTI